jgi:multicomponent Na+:H+ antiporter subunit D
MADQSPVIILLAPFIGAVLIGFLAFTGGRLIPSVAVVSLGVAVAASIATLVQFAEFGEIIYLLGNWPRPFGIEYRVDGLSALVVTMITVVALITALYSRTAVYHETPDKVPYFYILFLLLVTGLVGITLTGDAFNLYVLLEVSSLTSYALIAMGPGRAVFAAFKYVIMGTIGASFYLLGVGYLYIRTGSLNMVDIREQIVALNLYGSESILVAFMLIMVGVWIKMAFFPLHGWLPNAYSHAPTTSGCILAPLVTKVTIYIMIRAMMTIFGVDFVFTQLEWSGIITWMSVVCIIAGSVLALAQTDLRRTLSYLIVAEVGYMVGGVWLANHTGMVGAIYHILSDAFMTLCLFLAAGIIFSRYGHCRIKDMQGLFRKMPYTMAGFSVGALAIIGVPPTCGFFSKWYLIQGGMEAGHFGFVFALIFSSLASAIIFFRVIEVAWFEPFSEPGHEHQKSESPLIREAPISQLVSLYLAGATIVLIGIFNQDLIAIISESVRGFGLLAASG